MRGTATADAGRRATTAGRSSQLAAALWGLFAWHCPGVGAFECCDGAEPLITKFAQVDLDPGTVDDGLASLPFGQRALEIFNPSCDPINLGDFEIAITNPGNGKDPITRVSLSPSTHAGGRGHGSAWNVPSTVASGEVFVLCTYPVQGDDAASVSYTALQDASSLPAAFALSAFVNCTVASHELTQSTGASEGSMLLVRTEDDSIVDVIDTIPRVDRAVSQQECSVIAKRLEQFRHGNAEYNAAEWMWIWGSNCEGHPEVTIDSEAMNAYGEDLCRLADDPKFIDKSWLQCTEWQFYDCSLSHRTCGPGLVVGCSYTPAEEESLLLACPHSCGLCGTFGWDAVPDDDAVTIAEADNPGAIAPYGACANRSSTARVPATGSKYTMAPSPPQELTCCPGALPTITMFAQLGVEPFSQRAIEVYNPSCAKAYMEDYELVFIGSDGSGRSNETLAVISLNDVRPFKGTYLTQSDTLVLCSDFSHNMMSDEVFVYPYDDGEGNPNAYSDYPFLVQFIEEQSAMPNELIGSTWGRCTGNMSALSRKGIEAVALRSSFGGEVVDFVPLAVPALADPGSNGLACSVAYTRKPPGVDLAPGGLPPTTNCPTYNRTQWSEPIVGTGCTTIPAKPGGWQDLDLSGAELTFGERSLIRGWDATTQCSDAATALPAESLPELVETRRNPVESTCCEAGHPMITKFLQLDVQDTDSWTGRYQQRAIEIYNPTCQTIRLGDYNLLFLDDAKRIVGQVPLVDTDSEQRLAPQQTHVMCGQTGTAEPNMDTVNRIRVGSAAHIPANLVQSVDTECHADLLSPDGTTSWLLLPGLSGSLVLIRASNPKATDAVIYDAVESVPAMNPLSSKGLSCNLAWVRKQRVRSCSPTFNSSDWIKMVGVHCEDQPSMLTEHLNWYPATFGQREWLAGIEDDPCHDAGGILSSDYGVTQPVNPSPAPDDNGTDPSPCTGAQSQPSVLDAGVVGLPQPCRNGNTNSPRSKTLFDILGAVIVLVIGSCFACACTLCYWVRQRRQGKFTSPTELEMQFGVGGYSTRLSVAPQQETDFFTSPLADEGVADFTVTMGAGQLRQEISGHILASKGGANVTPWGGAFIMDDMSGGDGFENKVKVGKGSYGTVYKATFRGHVVAVKEIEIDVSPTNARQNDSAQAALREFKQELQVWCKLMHPNVVQFYGYTTTPVCIIQEFIEGGTLYELLTSSEMIDTDARMSFALDVAKGMAYLHGLSPPIIHRDLKSLNLLVAAGPPGNPPTVKLTDFGLARSKQTMMGETAKMTQVGTPYWTAPEIFDDAVYNESADVYSFAMVLYEIWARKLPWQGLQPVQVALKVVNERARPPVPAAMDTEECFGVSALMFECWGHEPSSRPTFIQCVLRLEEQVAIRLELGSGAEGQQHLFSSPGREVSAVEEARDEPSPMKRRTSMNRNGMPLGALGMTRSRTSSSSSTGGAGIPLSVEVMGRAGPPYAVIMPIELTDKSVQDGTVRLRRLLEGQLGMKVLEMMHWDPDFEEFCLLEDLSPLRQAAETDDPTPVRVQISV